MDIDEKLMALRCRESHYDEVEKWDLFLIGQTTSAPINNELHSHFKLTCDSDSAPRIVEYSSSSISSKYQQTSPHHRDLYTPHYGHLSTCLYQAVMSQQSPHPTTEQSPCSALDASTDLYGSPEHQTTPSFALPSRPPQISTTHPSLSSSL